MRSDEVVVVSGLPRSGTSMMMQMLGAGGMPLLTDGRRGPDASNPRGYGEYEPARHLARDASWMKSAAGKAVKIVSPLLRYLPEGFAYKVIFMERALPEVLASQRAMLVRLGQPAPLPAEDRLLAERFAGHLCQVKDWLARRPRLEVLYVDYRAAVAGEGVAVARRVGGFLRRQLDVEAMAAAMDPSLYHQRTEGPGPSAKQP